MIHLKDLMTPILGASLVLTGLVAHAETPPEALKICDDPAAIQAKIEEAAAMNPLEIFGVPISNYATGFPSHGGARKSVVVHAGLDIGMDQAGAKLRELGPGTYRLVFSRPFATLAAESLAWRCRSFRDSYHLSRNPVLRALSLVTIVRGGGPWAWDNAVANESSRISNFSLPSEWELFQASYVRLDGAGNLQLLGGLWMGGPITIDEFLSRKRPLSDEPELKPDSMLIEIDQSIF